MTKFTGYARSRGFQRIPVRDESRQIQQSSQNVLRDMEAVRQRDLQTANNHLQDIRDKHELEKKVRDANEQIRREYASSYIQAHERNMLVQAENQQYAINQKQAFVKDLIGFSDSLQGFAQQQIEKQREDQLNQANGIAARIGLTAEQFQQLKTLEGVLEDSERQNAPIYEEMLRRGATAEDLNVIINSSGYSRYAFGVASMQQSGRSLERYLSDNGNVQMEGYTTTLNAAEQQGLPEYNDILLRMQQDFISQNLSGFDPAFIAKYGKPEMDRTLARRQDYAAKIRRNEDAKIFDASRKQEWLNLAKQGAPAVMQRLQDLTGPDKTRFRSIVERNVPYFTELLEQDALPDNFVDDLSEVPLQIGNQQQRFGSLHSEVISRLRMAELDGTTFARRSIQAEQQLQRAETEQTMRAVVSEMSEQAINGTLEYNNIVATINEMEAQPGVFTQDDINQVKAFLPKTPSVAAAQKTIEQWNLTFALNNELPNPAQIMSSPLLPDQKLKWLEKHKERQLAGFDDDYKRIRDTYLKDLIVYEASFFDSNITSFNDLPNDLKLKFERWKKDYDDLSSSNTSDDIYTRHEKTQNIFKLRFPDHGRNDAAVIKFDIDDVDGQVKVIRDSLPQSPPEGMTRVQLQNRLKDGNENRLYTEPLVPKAILENYINNVNAGKVVGFPRAITEIATMLNISPLHAYEAQADLAGLDGKIKWPTNVQQFHDYVKGTPNSTISRYVQSRYHSRNRASRALIADGQVDPYSVAPQSHTDALVNAGRDLGVDPLDLATIIGFETAGSYSPNQMGGEGGVYMGLIQFGLNEQRTYGIIPGMTFEQQLTKVVQFFKDRFASRGMSTQGASLLQLYTTVIAGNPLANINTKDSFGTSALSGVDRMKPHRDVAQRRYFGGKPSQKVWNDESNMTEEALEMMRNR